MINNIDGLSIIIPYYNGSLFIEKNIHEIYNSSIKCKPSFSFEILIVVDSFSDNDFLLNLKNQFNNIRLLFNDKNIGVSKSRNRGWEEATYRYVYFIDQDDYISEHYFDILSSSIDNNADLYLYNGVIKDVQNKIERKIFYLKPKFNLRNLINRRTNILTPSVIVFDKSRILKNNLFDYFSTFNSGCDDWAAYIRLCLDNESLKYNYTNKFIVTYVKHQDNFSNNDVVMSEGAIDVLVSLLDSKLIDESTQKICKQIIKSFSYTIVKSKGSSFMKILLSKPSLAISYLQVRFNMFNHLIFRLAKYF